MRRIAPTPLVLFALALSGLAILAGPNPAPAQAPRLLPPAQVVPLDSIVDVRTLPAPAAPAVADGPLRAPKPARTPDDDGLRAWKSWIQSTPGALTTAPGVIQDAAPRVPAEASLAATVTHQFEGLANVDNVAVAGSGTLPPDSNLGVGPGHVFQMVNHSGRISDKAGTTIQTFSLLSFFQVNLDRDADPHVIYDALGGRWFAVYFEFSDALARSSIILAVSTTSDPTGTFCRYRLGDPTQETFLQDFPLIGVSDDKVVVSYLGFAFPADTGPFVGVGYYVLNKAQLAACAGSLSVHRVPPDPTRNVSHPSHAQTSTSSVYLASRAPNGDSLRVFVVSGIPGVTAVTETPITLAIRPWLQPPDAQQPDSPVLLDTQSARVHSPVWQSHSLWVTGHEGCVPPGDATVRSCLRLIEVRTDTSTLRQDMTFAGAPGEYFYFPALRPDASDNLHVVFNSSSATAFASVRISGRLDGDPLNTLQPSAVIRAGGGAQTNATGRMGDYSGAALDPSDTSKVWVIGEYIRTTNNADWGTFVAQLFFAPPCSPTPIAEFFPYDPGFRGGVFVAAGDVNGDGKADIVTGVGVGGGPHVRVLDGASLGQSPLFELFPYDPGFRGGVFVAAGDVNGDGKADIVTGVGVGGGPHVRVLDGRNPLNVLHELFPYDPALRSGVRVAAGDVNGDGKADIVTGVGAGGGPLVRVFDGTNPSSVLHEFFAYDPGFLGGVHVAAGDVNGDGKADIITGVGDGGGPHVKVFDGATGVLILEIFPYDPGFRGGVFVAAGDVDGDGKADIVTGVGVGGGPHVRVFSGLTGAVLTEFFPYDPGFRGGVLVGVGNVDGTGRAELITGVGVGGGPHVRILKCSP
jgi:hypothetical protein